MSIVAGTLTSMTLLPATTDTYALGSAGVRYSNVYGVLGNFSGAVATGALTVTGAQTISTTLAVTGDVAVNTDKFTVAGATGNTVVAGTLGVTGAVNVTGAVDFADSLTLGSGNVALVLSTGKLAGLSSTYLDDLDGTPLTGVAKLASANSYTARNGFLTYDETKTAPTISAGALTLDLSLGSAFTVALNAAITSLTISNPAASGRHGSFVIKFVADGTIRAITWPASFKWQGGSAPVAMTGTVNRKDFVTCVYDDAGTSYNCVISQNFPA